MNSSLKLYKPNADIFIPDNVPLMTAASRTTHMAIGAHQDDIEIMAFHGIGQCFQHPQKWFTGVTVTNGCGSPRAGVYQTYDDKMISRIRRQEQRKAAVVGGYSLQIQLDYASQEVKRIEPKLVDDLEKILLQCGPKTLYLHNIFDTHLTHVGVVAACIAALKRLPKASRPNQVVGVEIWGALDWLPDIAKVVLDVSRNINLQTALIGVFDSQISGGKRYDLALVGRNNANATFSNAQAVDQLTACQFAVNLMPLIEDEGPTIEEYIEYLLLRYKEQVLSRFETLI